MDPEAAADARAPVLQVRGLHAGYGDTRIVHGVDLEVGAHEVVAVLGPNGAGKSTVLKAVCGLAAVHAGSIVLRGADLTAMPPDALTRHGIGYVPQLDNVFPNLTVAENLDMGRLGAARGTDTDATTQHVRELFPALVEKWKARAGSLSGGQRQMLAMARALVAGPQLLLLDEPSAGLAPNLMTDVFDAVRRVAAEGVPILLVEQNARRALAVAHRAYILDAGSNAFSGTADELLADADVARLYLGRAAAAPAAPGPHDGPEDDEMAEPPLAFHDAEE